MFKSAKICIVIYIFNITKRQIKIVQNLTDIFDFYCVVLSQCQGITFCCDFSKSSFHREIPQHTQ